MPADANLQDLEDQIEKPTTNILTEAHTLFGAVMPIHDSSMK